MSINFSPAQRRILIRTIIYTIILVGAGTFYLVLNNLNATQQEVSNSLQNNITSLNSQITEANLKATAVANAVRLWERLKKEKQLGKGLRLQEARDLINELQTDYRLINMKVNLTKPQLTSASFESQFIKVEESSVTISFEAVSDEYALSFISRLIKDFPGYVSIQRFSIERQAPIDSDALHMLRKGQLPSLVRADLDFLWKDLKNHNAATDGNPTP